MKTVNLANITKAAEYRGARIARGPQSTVAAALGVDRVTLSRRENGKAEITKEATLALLSLPILQK